MNCGLIGHFKTGCRKSEIDFNNSSKKVDEVFLIDNITSNNVIEWKKMFVLIMFK